MSVSEVNPFQTPQGLEVELPEKVVDNTPRPKPWSVLSLVATALLLAIVSASLYAAISMANSSPNQGEDGGVSILVIVQGVLIGYWIAAGSGHLWIRLGLGALLLGGLYWEMMQFAQVLMWIFIPICLGAVWMTALADMILLACSKRRSARGLASGAMMIVGSVVLAVGYLCVQSWYSPLVRGTPADDVTSMMRISCMLGSCVAVGGIFLLIRKHLLARWWWIGAVLFLLVPAILVHPAFSWVC